MPKTPRKRIIFLDITCPAEYDSGTLVSTPQGGTESTVTRVAEALADHYDVFVAQHNRRKLSEGKAKYIPFEALEGIKAKPHAVVALRTPRLIPFVRKQFGDVKLILWMHDLNLNELVRDQKILHKQDVTILGVSQFHKTAIADTILTQVGGIKGVTTKYIYNPIADDLEPDTTLVDPFKLIFLSSPHKGLSKTIETFEMLRRLDDRYKLYVANPGYLPGLEIEKSHVVDLGTLTHAQVIKELRSAFLMFSANDVFPETFGLVLAESLAVGTPVLTHPLGAVKEVLGNPNFTIDFRQPKEVVDRILLLQKQGRPETKVNPEFRLTNVVAKWKGLLS